MAVAAGASLERKVAFLLDRDQEAQRIATALAGRLRDLEAALAEGLDALRDELKEHHGQNLAETLNRYRPLRIAGAFLLAFGIAAQVAGSIV